MAIDLRNGDFIDPCNGNLEKLILRHVGPAFVEDPRVLRACNSLLGLI